MCTICCPQCALRLGNINSHNQQDFVLQWNTCVFFVLCAVNKILFYYLREQSWYYDKTVGWMTRGSNSSRSERLFSSKNYADWHWGLPSLLSNWCWFIFLGVNGQRTQLTVHLHLALRLHMSSDIHNQSSPLYLNGVDMGQMYLFLSSVYLVQ